MLEAMLGSKYVHSWALDIPGPPALSFGTPVLGFFGETLNAELFTGATLASMVGLTIGTLQNDDTDWLKFASASKVLYIPKKPIRRNMSWNNLNNLGLVFGTTEVTIGSHQYKVRLMTGNSGREWDDLFYPIHVTHPGGAPAWADYTDDDLVITGPSVGSATWCQEAVGGYHRYRGYNSITYAFADAANSQFINYGWRPVLELVNPT